MVKAREHFEVDYVYQTDPYLHQHDCFMLSRDKDAFAILAEQGTGKTKIAIDTIAYLYANGKINTALVVAPNGVHRNWVDNEIPVHMPHYIDYRSAYWVATPRKADKARMEHAMQTDGHFLRIITMNVEALSTQRGKEFFYMLARATQAICIVDESTRIKTPGVKRTKTLIAAAKYFEYRRIMTGTPVTQGPFDFYSQFKFLDPHILGFTTYTAFKHHFAEFERVPTRNNRQGFYESLIAYRNLDELVTSIKPYSFRIRKKDCLDLPDKVYETRYVELSKEQKRLYDDLLKRNVAELKTETRASDLQVPEGLTAEEEFFFYCQRDDVGKVRAKNALTKLLRLQQIIGGFATDENGKTYAIENKNARIESLLELIEETEGKIIIWARFRAEIAAISAALKEKYGSGAVVEYHGGVSNEDRAKAIDLFQNKALIPNEWEGRFFVGQPHSAGLGLTLTAANTMIYFSQDFSLEARLQSEDRAHRIGQINKVTYIDLVAPDTVDARISAALLNKQNLANEIVDQL